MSNRGPKTPRVWTDRWVRKQTWHRDEHREEGGPESAQRMWRRVSVHNAERAQKGYSRFDWWSFDTFICGVIANACRDFRLKGHGFGNGFTPETWHAYLLGIEEPLRVWAEKSYDFVDRDEAEKAYEEAKAALHRFADELGSMWD